MSIGDEAATARQFVASREIYSTSWITGTKVWQAVYTVLFLAFVAFVVFSMTGTAKGRGMQLPRYTPLIILAVLLGASAIFGVYALVRSRQKCVLTVAGDALTIGSRDEVYSLADAQLGLWPSLGVALHLHSGGRRFVLGGHDRRIGPATPLDVEPIPAVDARLPASDFDELLRLGGRTAARAPAAGEPARCVLWPSAQRYESTGTSAFRRKQRLVQSSGRAEMFIDVQGDTIRIVDPDSHAVQASTSVTQVAATPLIYETTDSESSRIWRTPVLSLSVPGVPAITFGCPSSVERFSWKVPPRTVKDPPLCRLSGADWVTLIDTFGLSTPR